MNTEPTTQPPASPPLPGPTGSDSERLDWLMHHIGGKEVRELGIEYSGNLCREDIDKAMGKSPNKD